MVKHSGEAESTTIERLQRIVEIGQKAFALRDEMVKEVLDHERWQALYREFEELKVEYQTMAEMELHDDG